jgi:hypothetical protein
MSRFGGTLQYWMRLARLQILDGTASSYTKTTSTTMPLTTNELETLRDLVDVNI